MSENEHSWTVQLDWLNILNLLGLESINQISEVKRDKAIKKITKSFGNETLLELDPAELDNLVADELKELMKKELTLRQKKQEQIQKEMRSKFVPFKQGGIIKIDPRDFKDLDLDSDNPEDLLKALYKKLMGDKEGDEDEDEDNNIREDNTGYYI
ncbi:MAG: hypothetical protein EU535_04950 [Promethearchaeota archaeon]|nr:MAG: hypothetical protein EU535_04950 [Candidatus Lokiarchaeota archaeon]